MEIVNFTENVLMVFRRVANALETLAGNKKETINWEQRRYEIARDIYVHALIKGECGHSWASRYSHEAVEMADDLIEELKKKPDGSTEK